MKMTYGIAIVVDYNRKDPEHALRSSNICVRPSGRKMVRGAYSSILKKVRCLRSLSAFMLNLTR